MVRQTTALKHTWFKNDTATGGAMNEAIKSCGLGEIVIHSQTKDKGRLWGVSNESKLLKLLEKNNGIYEVITSFPHKVYFDVDKANRQPDEYLGNVKSIITKFFPNADMAISGNVSETKTSYHIVLSNYLIKNEKEREQMKHLVKYIQAKEDDGFDWKVYTKNRNMKAINQSKIDKPVQEIIECDDFKKHCITCWISNEMIYPMPEIPETVQDEIRIEKAGKTFDLGDLPKMTLQTPKDFDSLTATPLEMLKLLPLNNTGFAHEYTHLIARFCYFNEISQSDFFKWLRNKHDPMTQEIISKWENHWLKLDRFPPVSKDRILKILAFYYPNIDKCNYTRAFKDTFILPTAEIKKIESFNRGFLETANKYELVNIGMGGGKTATTIDYLTGVSNFVWIAPNRALALNTKKRFEMEDIDVAHYEEFNAKEKTKGALNECDKLIVCLNSLHYLSKNKTSRDVLIIDEIETLLEKFLGDFLEGGDNQNKSTIWNIFISLFRNSRKVILLDAFITTKTINFIKSLDADADMTIYERIYEPQTRTVHYVSDYMFNINDMIEKINQGKKCFIFYPYKRQCGDYPAMETLYETIIEKTNKQGVFYNADVDDRVKKGLKNVNDVWVDYSFVITNNIITCGLNYENKDFDYKYIFVASHNSPRDIVQVSYRARHLTTGIIKLSFLGKMNQQNTWLNDCEKMKCPIYTQLYNSILIEKKAPIKPALKLFFTKANYKQTTEIDKITTSIAKEIKQMFEEHALSITYNNIPDIDKATVEVIQQKCFTQDATMIEKYAMNKYFFTRSFKEDACPQTLAEIWDGDYLFFFKQIADILKNDDNVFTQISKLNKQSQLFPVDIKKTKLNKEIINTIFKVFAFKFISKTSCPLKIIKEIYNTYFKTSIIKTVIVNKNANYTIESELFNGYYEFARENLNMSIATPDAISILNEAVQETTIDLVVPKTKLAKKNSNIIVE
jgi:hypothetical protein